MNLGRQAEGRLPFANVVEDFTRKLKKHFRKQFRVVHSVLYRRSESVVACPHWHWIPVTESVALPTVNQLLCLLLGSAVVWAMDDFLEMAANDRRMLSRLRSSAPAFARVRGRCRFRIFG